MTEQEFLDKYYNNEDITPAEAIDIINNFTRVATEFKVVTVFNAKGQTFKLVYDDKLLKYPDSVYFEQPYQVKRVNKQLTSIEYEKV